MSDSAFTYIGNASKLLKLHHQLALFSLSIVLLGSIVNFFTDGYLAIVYFQSTLLALVILSIIDGLHECD
jgi:hypothetical protein